MNDQEILKRYEKMLKWKNPILIVIGLFELTAYVLLWWFDWRVSVALMILKVTERLPKAITDSFTNISVTNNVR